MLEVNKQPLKPRTAQQVEAACLDSGWKEALRPGFHAPVGGDRAPCIDANDDTIPQPVEYFFKRILPLTLAEWARDPE